MSHTDAMIAWLNDAHALEVNLTRVLENRVKDTQDHPMMNAKVREHLEETRRHAELVKGCIERLGGSVSAIKTGMSNVTGFMQGISTDIAQDQHVKNALADYASECFEIASYQSLLAGAQMMGLRDVAAVCQQILREEEAMAEFVFQAIPQVTQEFLQIKAREHGAS